MLVFFNYENGKFLPDNDSKKLQYSPCYVKITISNYLASLRN